MGIMHAYIGGGSVFGIAPIMRLPDRDHKGNGLKPFSCFERQAITDRVI